MSVTDDARAAPRLSPGTASPAFFEAKTPASPPLEAELCVLASGSSGNCSVLSLRRGGVRRVCLIDLGLSPRRTVRMLAHLGLGLHSIDDAVVTHLDSDHFHPGWAKAMPKHVTVHLHESHADRWDLFSLFSEFPAEPFADGFRLRDGTSVQGMLAAHDHEGVSTLRFRLDGGCLGFATDVGRMTPRLVDHLAGVEVLAIESNYCPTLQEVSDRPEFLKQRIMGGSGHLSNHEAAEAIRAISPRSHVVLLHLSRQCNDPEIVAKLHRDAPYGVTISTQHEPTGWVPICRAAALTPPLPTPPIPAPGAGISF